MWEKDKERERVFGWLWGLFFGVLITAFTFMQNSTYNGALVERGVLEYNATTGELQFNKGYNENK